MANSGRIRWTGEGMGFAGASARGGAIAFDETEGSLAPADDLLLALAGCTAMDVISILHKKRLRVDDYQVEVTGQRREAHPRAYTHIDVVHEVTGPDLDVEAVRRSIELSATRYCTVSATLSTGEVTVTHHYRVRSGAAEQEGQVVTTGPRGANIAWTPAGASSPAA